MAEDGRSSQHSEEEDKMGQLWALPTQRFIVGWASSGPLIKAQNLLLRHIPRGRPMAGPLRPPVEDVSSLDIPIRENPSLYGLRAAL